MLAPKEKSLALGEGKYTLKSDFGALSVVELYSAIKKGCEDAKIKINSCLGKEGYILDIEEVGIRITASCDEGIFRAVTSLWQIIKRNGKDLPCLHIEDEPQIPRRGYMYDISRGKMLKVETIKKIIDVLCIFKYNEFQLYMEGDCFDYSEFPEYGKNYSFFGKEEIRELEAYCKERFIDLVPNQNSFGHLAVWLKYDEFKHLGLGDGTAIPNTLNPLDDESFEFVKKLFDSLLPHFESEYVNIGLDEAYGLGLYQTEEYCKEHGKETLWLEWMEKINSYIKEKYNKKVMYWADMIVKNREIYKSLPKDAVALEWGYENQDMGAMGEHCSLFRELGIDFYVCPSCNTHMSFTGRSDVVLSHIRTSSQIGVRNGAKGLLLTQWGSGQGETGHPHFPIWELIPIGLAGMYAWNIIDGERDGIGFGVDYLEMVQSVLDDFVFGCKGTSELLFRMGNYYLLEPMRIPVGTMIGGNFWKPVAETKLYNLFDLKKLDVEFFYANVISYIKKILSEMEKLPLRDEFKREMLMNSRLALLGSEISLIRGKTSVEKSKAEELCRMIDDLVDEFRSLWDEQNYEVGREVFAGHLEMHKKDILAMKSL